MTEKRYDELRYERIGTNYTLVDSSGKKVKRLELLPSLEDPDMKRMIEGFLIPHFVMGNRWYIYDSKYMELEEIYAPVYENGIPTGEFMKQSFLTVETVEKAKVYWKSFISGLSSKEKTNKN